MLTMTEIDDCHRHPYNTVKGTPRFPHMDTFLR